MDKLPGRRRSKHEQQLSGSESLSAMGSATLSDPGPVFTVTPSLGISTKVKRKEKKKPGEIYSATTGPHR
jgi:hypothetical protein